METVICRFSGTSYHILKTVSKNLENSTSYDIFYKFLEKSSSLLHLKHF